MSISLTTNFSFKKQDLGHPERDTFTAANLDMIDAAIQAGVSPLTAAKIIVGNALNVAVGVVMSGDISIDNAGVTTIGADKVANTMLENMTRGTVKVGGVANAPTDLQAKTDAQILIGDATDLNSVPVTGDVTIDNAGLTAIGADKVLNTMLANIARGSVKVGGAADAPTDLIAKGDAKLLLGDATDLNSVSMSGDVTIDNTGLTAIGAGKVVKTMVAADVAGGGLVQAVGKELDVNVDDSTLEIATDVVKVKDLGVTIAKLEAALLKGIVTVPMSFETSEETITKLYFPMKVTINLIRSIVMLAIAGTDDGTITGANSTGASSGVVTVGASSALNVEDSADPVSNVVVEANGYYQLTSAKNTKGGKVLVTLEYTRTA